MEDVELRCLLLTLPSILDMCRRQVSRQDFVMADDLSAV